ncbi:beta-1,4-mannosyl-glycoprotein 4-beta-N-acetylglucosaminyltransferase [Musca vetustissima]|uniref:beta-1,4-mannosyl-glycoprotein 4-beta-N-acetylglucosaminyltransferase n=1 Tax=Musca vetustissima TaxID=27455 RepID=UPI002AB5E4F3|nr:beta-1,4-mannosyl-glycoprotein 4-beta-N-acetylglucosaminyltransferase [Musca vetustissima]
MHLRLASNHHQQQHGCDLVTTESTTEYRADTMQLIKQPLAGMSGGQQQYQQAQHLQHQQQSIPKRTKRFFLWTILLIQFAFILCFWLMQLGLSGRLKESTGLMMLVKPTPHNVNEEEEGRINFIKPAAESLKDINNIVSSVASSNQHFQWPSRDLKFQQDFELQKATARYNLTEAEKLMYDEASLWCFKEGTSNDTQSAANNNDGANETWPDNCPCLAQWHGQDCGQPEVIWRALLTAKKSFKLQNPTQSEAHRLVYMLEGHFISMDLLELQIQAVIKVVDYFIIHYKQQLPVNMNHYKTIKFKLKQMLPERNYMLYHCKLPKLKNCSSADVYRQFRQQQLLSNAIKPTDIFIYTDDKVILSHRALNFLKYYSSNVPLILLRLKLIIYGFYWQHPDLTKLDGLISSFQQIDNSNTDPLKLKATLLHNRINTRQQESLVIGDLNHFGGWYCKYCQEPEEVITELQQSIEVTNNTNSNTPPQILENLVTFPKDKKHSLHIDSTYIQQLISTGLYLNDGSTQLVKVRRFADKYFAPSYAVQQSWKYGHLLVNIYESLDDVLDDDNEMF